MASPSPTSGAGLCREFATYQIASRSRDSLPSKMSDTAGPTYSIDAIATNWNRSSLYAHLGFVLILILRNSNPARISDSQ